MRTAVIIPARDEEGSIAAVVARCRAALAGARVIVVDNGSRDATARRAADAGAVVVDCRKRGYGHAARAGTDAARGADIYVYLDADGSMAPEQVPTLVAPIARGEADVVCGRRRGDAPMPWHQRVGNRVIARLLRRHGIAVAELGPFRAVRAASLDSLALGGSRYAWAAEMLVRAAHAGAVVVEVPVGYGPRLAGRSKVGGSLRGSLEATWDIARALTPRGPR